MSLKLGIVGFGKIARDQHVPAIAAVDGIELIAISDPFSTSADYPSYASVEQMIANHSEIDAIALCQPPQFRYAAARVALEAGKHVFMEKPPGKTVSEVEALIEMASQQNVTLFAAWHSRYGAAVTAAKDWLLTHPPRSVTIIWKEDVRVWHPGQDWIWQAGGFGVFDPGINALSILTEIVGETTRLVDAMLDFPSNRQAPIAAHLEMETAYGVQIKAEFDFRQTGAQTWDIQVATDDGNLILKDGGNTLSINGQIVKTDEKKEYPEMYRHFVDLVRAGRSDVDLAPLKLVSDAFMTGQHRATDPFLD